MWQCYINSQLLVADLVTTEKSRIKERLFIFFLYCRQQANFSNLVETTSKKSYIPTIHSKLCSLHFKFEDFVTDSTDQKTWRKRKRLTFSLIRR